MYRFNDRYRAVGPTTASGLFCWKTRMIRVRRRHAKTSTS